MKKGFIFLLLLLLTAGVAVFFIRKSKIAAKELSPVVTPNTSGSSNTSGNSVPDRLTLINQMYKYIDKIYQSSTVPKDVDPSWSINANIYRKKAITYVNNMYTWCLEKQGGWSFETQQADADKHGYPLALEMVNDMAWQLSYNKTYSDAVWHVLEQKILDIALSEKS